MRDERSLLQTALAASGLEFQLVERDGKVLVAELRAASVDAPDGADFIVDAPPGWCRVASIVPRSIPPTEDALLGLNALYARTGFGQVHWDSRASGYRLVVHLLADTEAPLGSAILAAVQHLLLVRRGLLHGAGDPTFVDDPPPPGFGAPNPTLEDAVRRLGTKLGFAYQVDHSFVAPASDPRGAGFSIRAHTMRPGVFAFDAILGRTPSFDPRVIGPIHALNAALTAGSVLLAPDGVLLYRWACPYVWLPLAELEGGALLEAAHTAVARCRYEALVPRAPETNG